MLSQVLPGIRDLRGPLAAGYLWLFGIWLIAEPSIPDRDSAAGFWESVFRLGDIASDVILALGASLLAYLIGSLSLGASLWLLRRRGLLQLSGESQRSVASAVRQALDRISTALEAEPGDSDVDPQERLSRLIDYEVPPDDIDAHEMVTEQQTRLIRSVVEELDLVATRLIGVENDLYSTYDRIRAEAELRLGLAPPLAGLVLVLAVRHHIAWAMLLALAVAILLQGINRHRDANDLLADAILLGRASAPTLERLEQAAKEGRRGLLITRGEEPSTGLSRSTVRPRAPR